MYNFGLTESRFIGALDDMFRRKKSIGQSRDVSERQPKRHLIKNPNVARGEGQVRSVWSLGQVMRERLCELRPKQICMLRVSRDAGGKAKGVREKHTAPLANLAPKPVVQNAHPDITGINR